MSLIALVQALPRPLHLEGSVWLCFIVVVFYNIWYELLSFQIAVKHLQDKCEEDKCEEGIKFAGNEL